MLRKMKEAEFKTVYEILESSFDCNEIRSAEGQKRLFKDSAYSVLVNDDITAVLGVWDFGDIRYIEHLATDGKVRNTGIGGRVLDEYIKSGKTAVILEVELPGEELTDRRIAFYKRHGFKFNSFSYIQPPMEEGKSPVPLRIMSYPESITEEQFNDYRKILYTRVYGCEEKDLGTLSRTL
ncbi:MAG: GNAT family N-acetyltransferase [Firmicutes bacterium]|nr:GNAT family N-acetyltransferase [Bacillota bacterium]